MNNKLYIMVNPQIELLMTVLLTGSYAKLCKQLVGHSPMSEEDTIYISEIKEYFYKFRSNQIYDFLNDIIPKGFYLGAPIEAVLSLGKPPYFEKVRNFSDFAINRAGSIENLTVFIKCLRSFANESNYMKFFEEHRLHYNDIFESFINLSDTVPYIDILENFYGKKQHSYNVYITQLSKGSFGPSFQNLDEQLDIYNICGVRSDFVQNRNQSEFVFNILWHEFSHSTINALTDKFKIIVDKYSYLLDEIKQYKVSNAGYGPWDECVNEHIIRAIAIFLCNKYINKEIANHRLNYDIGLGYVYIPSIIERLNYYERNRDKYHYFSEYYSTLLIAFSDTI